MAGKEEHGVEILVSNSIDKIGDANAKEMSLSKSRVTRKRTYDVLFAGLSATRGIEETRADGTTVLVQVPDFLVQHKFLETSLKLFGDLKDRQEIEMSHKMEDSDRELLRKYGIIISADKKTT